MMSPTNDIGDPIRLTNPIEDPQNRLRRLNDNSFPFPYGLMRM